MGGLLYAENVKSGASKGITGLLYSAESTSSMELLKTRNSSTVADAGVQNLPNDIHSYLRDVF
jgi:hypothetical protein